MRKPDPRAYAHVPGLLGVEAGETLFPGDFEPTVDGAVRMRMRAIHLVDHDATIVEARTLLGLPG